MTITVRAEVRVPSRNRGAFVDMATALADAASREAGTLRYDWYRSEDPALFVVIEEYTDPEAALAHNEHCATLLRSIAELVEMTAAHLHGHLGPGLDRWVATHSFAHAHPPLLAGS